MRRKLPLRCLSALRMSDLSDNFLAIVNPTEYDCLLVPSRLTPQPLHQTLHAQFNSIKALPSYLSICAASLLPDNSLFSEISSRAFMTLRYNLCIAHAAPCTMDVIPYALRPLNPKP